MKTYQIVHASSYGRNSIRIHPEPSQFGRHGSAHAVTRSLTTNTPFFMKGKKSVTQGSIHYTIYNPGGGIAPKSCLPAALKGGVGTFEKPARDR